MTGKKRKEDAIIIGPFVGEMFWEFFRFVPHVLWELKNYQDIKIKKFVYTRPDRFDMYGDWVDYFVPLNIKGDGIDRFGECFRMMNLSHKDFIALTKNYYDTISEKYNIIKHFYFKDVDKKSHYLDKQFYLRNEMCFDYKERHENTELIEEFTKNINKKIILIAPRFRYNFKRNWPYWEQFYDLIYDNEFLMDNFEFIICGKNNEYIPDIKRRFLDINKIKLGNNSSLIGLLMALMKKTTLTVGSQSAIPNISLLFKVPALEWGNQRQKHTVDYNIRRTYVKFLDDKTFTINPHIVFLNLMKMIQEIING